jgi:hypothetical protein
MTNKLAVLISGSFRNFDSVWPINKSILDKSGIPYEVFFHTWDSNPNLQGDILSIEYKTKFYFSLFPKKYEIYDQIFSVQSIQKKFGFRCVLVDQFPEKSLVSSYNLGNPNTNSRHRQLLNSVAQYYGIDACRKEMIQDVSFSHFLRLRTDFQMDKLRFSELFKNDFVFFGQLLPTPEGPIGDQCFGGIVKKTVEILDMLETLHEITHDLAWDTSEPMVLAEEVIRRRIYPLRDQLKIAYFDGAGKIRRPKLVREKFSVSYLQNIFSHNTKFLINLPFRILSRVERIRFN